ncbi:MAG: DUF4126 domain-containing protein [Myxococcota bacterium]|nr:DUF4126 domain-containing protein [Myxococcota bacterium]
MEYWVAALLLGFVSGLRAMMSPCAVAWAVRQGVLSVAGVPVAFMGYAYTAVVFTVVAVAEVVNDKLPWTPSRKVPPQFIARILSGALVGACVAASSGALVIGAAVGVVGAVAGTFGGAFARGKLAAAFGKDLPAAIVEDLVAVGLSVAAIMSL